MKPGGMRALIALVAAWCAVEVHGESATVDNARTFLFEGVLVTPAILADVLVRATRRQFPSETAGLSDDAVADIVLARSARGPQEAVG